VFRRRCQRAAKARRTCLLSRWRRGRWLAPLWTPCKPLWSPSVVERRE
jgi:hypothetical protein